MSSVGSSPAQRDETGASKKFMRPGRSFFASGDVAQLVRAPRLHRGGQGFESLRPYQKILLDRQGTR